MDFLLEAKGLFEDARNLRRDFHQYPELGFKEYRTAAIISRELENLGLEVSSGIAETGVIGVLEGNRPGPCVMLRFDMDALPVNEENQVEYRSCNTGVMHACGHDGHMAIGLMVARLLSTHKAEFPGTIKFVFQPAEEGLGGAEQMIAGGALENPRPAYCLGMHLWNERPVGWVGVVPGPLMAGADKFRVVITGKGGHGAIPDQTVDPIAATAQIVTALQTIVSRNIPPLKTAVISVTYIRAGEAYNVIPQTAEIRGTIRTFESDIREKVITRFEAIIQGISSAMGCSANIELLKMTPSVVNNPEVTALVAKKLQNLGVDKIDSTYQTMVSEDMAEFLNRIPGCFLMVGSAGIDPAEVFPHHHPRFDIDENAMVYGIAWMSASAIELLTTQPSV